MKQGRIRPDRKRGGDHFVGIHFDVHAGRKNRVMGQNVTPAMVENIIKTVRPDFIQVDSKGHSGICSFKPRAGWAVANFVKDQLKIWRAVTAKHNVALYLHHSGVWDNEAVRRHPEWGALDAKRKQNSGYTSLFSPYVDEILIPTLKGACDDYGVDGVWVDGDNWAVDREYNKRTLAEFRKATGIRTIPKEPTNPGYREFNEFMRIEFRRYLKHYVDALHAHNPEFRVTSNWSYSAVMPEPVEIAVDRLSGDSVPPNGVNVARFEARGMARQGVQWDFMSWGFVVKVGGGPARYTKPAIQLKQEAAIALAQGGGFQVYYKQREDCSIFPWQMKRMGEVADFCRARKKFCYKAKPISQIALLNSRADLYWRNPNIMNAWKGHLKPLAKTLECLLDGQNSVELLSEHHLSGHMKDYPLIVLPECVHLEKNFIRELRDYVRGGGKLLCIGTAAGLFARDMDVKLLGELKACVRYFRNGEGFMGIQTMRQKVIPGRRAKVVEWFYADEDEKSRKRPAVTLTRVGKGMMGAIHFAVGEPYLNGTTEGLRSFVSGVVGRLFPTPLVRVDGTHLVEVVPTTKDGLLCINLINLAGPHGNLNHYTYDEVPALGPFTVHVRARRMPSRVRLQPEGRALKAVRESGGFSVVIPRLEIHSILVLEG